MMIFERKEKLPAVVVARNERNERAIAEEERKEARANFLPKTRAMSTQREKKRARKKRKKRKNVPKICSTKTMKRVHHNPHTVKKRSRRAELFCITQIFAHHHHQ
jgi:hypothetical protein